MPPRRRPSFRFAYEAPRRSGLSRGALWCSLTMGPNAIFKVAARIAMSRSVQMTRPSRNIMRASCREFLCAARTRGRCASSYPRKVAGTSPAETVDRRPASTAADSIAIAAPIPAVGKNPAAASPSRMTRPRVHRLLRVSVNCHRKGLSACSTAASACELSGSIWWSRARTSETNGPTPAAVAGPGPPTKTPTRSRTG